MSVILPIRVMAYETDYGGVVSNTRYLEYIERGRYALLHAGGLKMEEVVASIGVQFVVRKVEVEYLSPAKHEDELELAITVDSHSRSATHLSFKLHRKGEEGLLMRATQTLVYINEKWRPTRVPQLFLDAFPIAQQEEDQLVQP